MQRWIPSPLRHLSVVSLCVGAGLLAPAGAGAVSPAGCANRVNDTPAKLIPCVQKADLWNYMQNFQAIAVANPGADGHPSRNSGEPGYKASVDYVAGLMKAAGYNVTIQKYTFDYFSFVGTPQFSEVSPTAQNYVLNSDWDPAHSTCASTGCPSDRPVQPAGGIVNPPTPTPSSQSGCTSADFSGFIPGNIALVQRGTCTFATKVANATAAGASGVIIFNEGNPGRTGVFNGTLGGIASVPVAFTSWTVGNALYQQYQSGQAPTVTLSIQSIEDPNRPDYNLIADSKGGDPNSVLVVDAHLDAIYGEGMLDNASGSATILDIAQMMRKVNPLHKIRFIWFGGEELGLLGSSYYVNNLSSTDLGHIFYDLDADVTATPNYIIGVLDPAGVDLFGRTVSTTSCSAPSPSSPCFPANVYGPSQISRDQSINYFNSIGKNHELFSPVGTDAFNFNVSGIPASGLLTGQDCCKSQDEVNMFGGQTGNYEGNLGTSDGGCVDNPFLWCDNLSNNDPNVLTFISKAFANTVVRMAYEKTGAAASAAQAKRTASAARAGRSRRAAAQRWAALTDNGRYAIR